MIKKLLLLTLVSCFGFCSAYAQQQQQPIPVEEYLSAGNIKAPFLSDGILFWNPYKFVNNGTINNQWESPKGSGKNTIFAGGLWIGGQDQNNDLYLAIETYRQVMGGNYGNRVNQSFFYGPVASSYNTAFDSKYNKVWKVTAAEIDYHKQNYRRRLYVMPPGIADWPAHGDVTNGEAANLAPFADVNKNGIYEPLNGDFPVIRGAEAVYFIFNDSRFPKTPLPPAMDLEIHGMAYTFDTPSDSALYNSIFINYRIINRSVKNYKNVHIGMWTDFDIGSYNDDYIASDVQLNAFYGFNGFPVDSFRVSSNPSPDYPPPPFPQNRTYSLTPPAQGVAFLGNFQMSSFLYFDNSADAILGDPRTPLDFYNYLRAIWRNNNPVTFGGRGITTTSIPYKFMYPGNSDPTGRGFSTPQAPPSNWQMSDSYQPTDVRGVGSIGPLNLNAGQEICFDVAFPFAQGNDNMHSVRLLKRYIDQINQFHSSTYGSNCIQNQRVSNPLSGQRHAFESFFPNPATKEVTLHFDQRLTDDITISIFDINGRRQSSKILKKDSSAEQTIGLENLKPGIYILNLVDGSASEKIRLVITN